MSRKFALAALFACASCGMGDKADPPGQTDRVATTGKTQTALASVPKEVLAVAQAAQPTATFNQAESETRDGRNYYDIAGKLPDGSEVELDLLQGPQGWVVVETQRDIALASAPAKVRAALATADAKFVPSRVIESRQNDQLVIFEFFGPTGQGTDPRKIEVRYDGKEAEILTKEWAH